MAPVALNFLMHLKEGLHTYNLLRRGNQGATVTIPTPQIRVAVCLFDVSPQYCIKTLRGPRLFGLFLYLSSNIAALEFSSGSQTYHIYSASKPCCQRSSF